MNDNLTFLNAAWVWPALIFWLISILVFIWKEWTSPRNKGFIVKVVLIFFSVSSLALLALKPAILKEVNEGRVVITTDNFKQTQLDSLKKTYRNLKVIDYNNDESLLGLVNSEEIFVLGSGIASYDLWSLENTTATYLSGHELSGIIKLNYKQENKVGNQLDVKGIFANRRFKNRLVLQDAAGTALDSAVFGSKEKEGFQLSTTLKVSGNYVFSIIEKDSLGEVLNRNALPVKIQKRKAPRILILNTYPTFEIKYLKNFLADLGHEVTVKNRITTGRYKFEFFNAEQMNLRSLNSSNLGGFDLVILDSGFLKTLSNSERNALQKSIKATGLGLFILGEAKALNNLGDFSVFTLQPVSTLEVGFDELKTVRLTTQPFRLKQEFGLEEIHTLNASIFSAYKRSGQGRIGTTMLQNTWQLLLDGKQEAYQQIWSDIIEQLSKREFLLASFSSVDKFVLKDEPFTFQLRTSKENPIILDQYDHLIPLKQDLNVSETWSGVTYPLSLGWQRLNMEQDSTSSFEYYVHQSDSWKSLRHYQTQQANMKFFQEKFRGSKDIDQTYVAIHPFWFFGIFIFSMTGLWLLPKL
ncbi:hypothetical protein [Psychroflexus lacisalsi]|jgi:uncharacterized protein YbgA (DUF1722 family)|uniref:Aerotolerance regulator N-terminal domain-containing protein n=1 Tax=Psychroflexus lacisalsi TaxID=503928 RepID=A0ABP3VDB2_9FLAO|nr:hypothetical protein [Psychroflexus lacisalsi]MBZ9619146.1 hypothetical protein [Psychroflexus lacisalsi]